MSLILISLILSSVSYGFSMRDLTNDEVNTLNWILQCPNELAKVTQEGEWIGSGKFYTDRAGSRISYRFFRRIGFTSSEYVTSLHISRVRIHNPPADAPSFRVECEIQKESL